MLLQLRKNSTLGHRRAAEGELDHERKTRTNVGGDEKEMGTGRACPGTLYGFVRKATERIQRNAGKVKATPSHAEPSFAFDIAVYILRPLIALVQSDSGVSIVVGIAE